jgi:hypothetical protein
MTTDHWMTLAVLIISAVSLGLNFHVLRSKWMPVSRRRLKEAENKYQKLRRAVGAVDS